LTVCMRIFTKRNSAIKKWIYFRKFSRKNPRSITDVRHPILHLSKLLGLPKGSEV